MAVRKGSGIYRKVDPRVWSDERFIVLGDDGKLVWLLLLTGPQVLLVPGLQAFGPGAAGDELRWPGERAERAFTDVVNSGLAEYDSARRLVRLPQAPLYNLPENRNVVRGWLKPFTRLPDCQLRAAHLDTLGQAAQMGGVNCAAEFVACFGDLVRASGMGMGMGSGMGMGTQGSGIRDQGAEEQLISPDLGRSAADGASGERSAGAPAAPAGQGGVEFCSTADSTPKPRSAGASRSAAEGVESGEADWSADVLRRLRDAFCAARRGLPVTARQWTKFLLRTKPYDRVLRERCANEYLSRRSFAEGHDGEYLAGWIAKESKRMLDGANGAGGAFRASPRRGCRVPRETEAELQERIAKIRDEHGDAVRFESPFDDDGGLP